MITAYQTIEQLWIQAGTPAITRPEAERAAARLFRRFGKVEDGSPNMRGPARFDGRARACWITRQAGQQRKGWARLVHDTSHEIFSARHPTMRPHAGGHGALELEMARHVVEQGWLAGTLRERAPARLTRDERQAKRLRETIAGIGRWERKRQRAERAIRKLTARRRRLERAIDRTKN